MQFDSTPAWSFGHKPRLSNNSPSPGPGTYPPGSLSPQRGPASFPRAKPHTGPPQTGDVGPGQYNTGGSTLSRIGGNIQGKRYPREGEGTQNPGPGDYEVKDQGWGKGYSMPRAKTHADRFQNDVGPGNYNVPDDFFSRVC